MHAEDNADISPKLLMYALYYTCLERGRLLVDRSSLSLQKNF
jgi:hypothetical protein